MSNYVFQANDYLVYGMGNLTPIEFGIEVINKWGTGDESYDFIRVLSV